MTTALTEGLRRLAARNDAQRAAILNDVPGMGAVTAAQVEAWRRGVTVVPAYALWAAAVAAGASVDELIAAAGGEAASANLRDLERRLATVEAELEARRIEDEAAAQAPPAPRELLERLAELEAENARLRQGQVIDLPAQARREKQA
jgi:hypothetical protein